MSKTTITKNYILPLLSAYLFGAYPIIFLWSKNWEDVFIQEIAIDLSIVLVATTVFYFCYLSFFKNPLKTSIACCLTNFMFFSFGYIFDHTSPLFILLKSKIKIWNYNVLIPLWILCFLICLYLLKKTSPKTSSFLFTFQNILSLTLIGSASLPLFSHLTRSDLFPQEKIVTRTTQAAKKLPNIYYIILDEYGRQDALKSFYHYDNRPFLSSLKKIGFFIAEKSCSNYSMTALSIPSSLSMNFLNIDKEDKEKPYYSNWIYSPSKTINTSPLIQTLKKNGYLFINVSSGFSFTLQIKSADREMVNYYLSSFTDFLLDQSLFGPFSRKFPDLRLSGAGAKIIFNQLSCLGKTPSIESPHFVFCHIICPHSPFIFDEEGNEIENYEKTFDVNNDYLAPYRQQVAAINKKILKTIENILEQDSESIIVLQGDHGPSCYGENFRYFYQEKGSFNKGLLVERMGILNAYHFPKENPPTIPNNITPVNSFRIILNHYLGTNLPLLPNKCCWSTVPHPFKFTEYPVEEINTIELKGWE